MVKLEDVLSSKIIKYSKEAIIVQEIMMKISYNTINESIKKILNLDVIHSDDGILSISDNAYFAAQYRPFLIHPLAKLIFELSKNENDDNCLHLLKKMFLRIPPKIMDQKWKIALLHGLYVQGFYNDEEMYQFINDFFNQYPIIPNLPFWKNNSRQEFLIFVWFAPLIHKMDEGKYNFILEKLKQCVEHHDLISCYNQYLELLPKIQENNWKLYEAWASNLYLEDSLAYILKNDDVDRLKTIKNLDENTRIEPTVFEFSLFLSRKPNILQFAAFYGAEKCFNYIESIGNFKDSDYGKRNLLHFALSGGNLNIILKSLHEIPNYDLATRLAAEFHRFDIFQLLYKSHKLDIKSNDLKNGSIFHGIASSNHVKMILFCIEQGCDVNQRDGIY